MVLLGQWGAKHGHGSITHRWLERAAVLLHRVLDAGIERLHQAIEGIEVVCGMVCGWNDWRTTEDGDHLALAWRAHRLRNGRRESLHDEWACRLSLRHQQGRREDAAPFRRRDWRRTRLHVDRDWDHATIAIPMDRLDEVLGLPSIPDGLPHRPHRTAQCGFTDELVGPDLFTQLMFSHDTISMF
jgi:hypothetical protein